MTGRGESRERRGPLELEGGRLAPAARTQSNPGQARVLPTSAAS